MSSAPTTLSGRCDCGGVRFTVTGARPTVTVCHCSQCRRFSGHLWASTHAPIDAVTFASDETLVWHASSSAAKRGFCGTCGASLFYRLNGEDGIGVAAGCLDTPTGLVIGKHIFTEDASDYAPAPTPPQE